MSKPVLYYDDVSPPVRSVLLTIAALDINDKIDLSWIHLFGAAHLKEDFVKVRLNNLIFKTSIKIKYLQINPLHTVPVLQHEDLVLTDSHAILVYLCDIFGTDSSFSLENPKQRAKVLNRLCFNNSIFFARDAELMVNIPVFRKLPLQ